MNEEIKKILLKNIGPLAKQKRNRNKWMDVKGYEKMYEVSNTGKVRCKGFARTKGQLRSRAKRKILKPYLRDGVARIYLTGRDRKQKEFRLKKLVADHWFKPHVDSRNIKLKDKDPFNCALSNMYSHKRKDQRKHSDEEILYIAEELEKNKGKRGFQKELSERLGVDKSVISYIKQGRRPKSFKDDRINISS